MWIRNIITRNIKKIFSKHNISFHSDKRTRIKTCYSLSTINKEYFSESSPYIRKNSKAVHLFGVISPEQSPSPTTTSEENMTKNCVHSIPCNCGKEYKDKISYLLKMSVEEFQKTLIRFKIPKLQDLINTWPSGLMC